MYFDLFSQGVIYFEILYNQFFTQLSPSCSNLVQACKFLYVMLYGSGLVAMGQQAYHMDEQELRHFIVGQFDPPLRQQVAKMLSGPGVNMYGLVAASFALRFKSEVFAPQVVRLLDAFFAQFAGLLSCEPARRRNPYACRLFRIESQNIVSSLPAEALDNLTVQDQGPCRIDAELRENGLTLYNTFTQAGGRFCFQNVVANGLLRVFSGGIAQFQSYHDIRSRIRSLHGAAK